MEVPYTVYETAQARADRRFKRMWWLVIILFIAFVSTNAGWIYYASQFETVTTTIEAEQEADNGTNYVVGGDYGKTESESNY